MKSAGDKVHTVTIIRVQSILDDVGHCENVKNNFLNKPNYFPDARLKQPNSRAATARLGLNRPIAYVIIPFISSLRFDINEHYYSS